MTATEVVAYWKSEQAVFRETLLRYYRGVAAIEGQNQKIFATAVAMIHRSKMYRTNPIT